MPDRRPLLTLPDAKHVEHPRNFVHNAACELRFPTLLKFESQPPEALQHALRERYPYYQRVEAQGSPPSAGREPSGTRVQHQLRSKERDWAVLVTSSSVSLEALEYTSFTDFWARLEQLVGVVVPMIDSAFFTRLGLRYVDTFPYLGPLEFEGWLNPTLTGSLTAGPFLGATTFWQESRGAWERGRYSVRHGLTDPQATGPRPEYILDFDVFEENVGVESALTAIGEMHQVTYKFFSWAMGPKAIAAISE